MKVKKLVEILKKMNQDHLVVLQKDAEGNGHSPLSDVGTGAYVAESPWAGELVENEYGEDLGPKAEKVVVLYPVN